MLQVVAGLTVVFVGYVLYEVFKTVSSHSSSQRPAGAAAPAETSAAKAKPAEPAVAEAPKAKPEAAARKAEPAARSEPPAARKAAVTAKKDETKAEAVADQPAPTVEASASPTQLKDPVSGEMCPVPTNYRFAKKWVKEALVAEGLLDKVYKTADLDEAGTRKVREALEKFRAMTKYYA